MRRATWLAVLAVGTAACGGDEPAVRPAGPAVAAPGAPAATAPSPPARKAGTMPKVGEAAPDFRVRDHTGKERTLAEFRGKRVVLWFYPKADTGG